MNDSGNLTKDNHSVQYIYDALKERLPSNWSLNRADGPSIDGTETPSGFYRWTNWNTGDVVQIEIHEAFASKIGVDALCDFVMYSVMDCMNDPNAKFRTPRWKAGVAPIPLSELEKLARRYA